MSNDYFCIHIETDVELCTSDIWPDGDAPENPTTLDVAKAMEECGNKRTVLDDWGLTYGLEVTVTGGLIPGVSPVWKSR